MRKKLFLFLLILCFWQTPSHANEKDSQKEFQIAVKTFESGEHEKALKTLKELFERTFPEGNRSVEISAENWDEELQFKLGWLYSEAKGGLQNYNVGKEFYHLSAKQNHAQAQFNLGILYADGKGVSQDYGEAEKWYHLSAKQGNARAQNNLGVLYKNGNGTPANWVDAYMWYSIAKANGNKEAQENTRLLEKQLTPSILLEAQAKAKRCKKSYYKDCD